MFCHTDGAARIIHTDLLSKVSVNLYGFLHDSSLFAPPVTIHLNSQGYSKPLGEREFTWRGTREDGSTFFNFSETETILGLVLGSNPGHLHGMLYPLHHAPQAWSFKVKLHLTAINLHLQ